MPGQPQQSRWEEGKRCQDLDRHEDVHIMAHASFEPQKMDSQCADDLWLHVGFAHKKFRVFVGPQPANQVCLERASV